MWKRAAEAERCSCNDSAPRTALLFHFSFIKSFLSRHLPLFANPATLREIRPVNPGSVTPSAVHEPGCSTTQSTSPSPLYPRYFHHCCSYLVIPIPGPPTPIPPPAADPLTGFMCCPATGPVAGPPGITDPIIPAAPGSPGCPPPSMLASFPISARETGGRWRKELGQIAKLLLSCYVVSF